MTRSGSRATGAVALLLLLGACTAESPAPAPQAAPPDPPAACLLDPAALASLTGVTWTPDPATASDTRCVYDVGRGPAGPVFLTVTVAQVSQADPAAEIESLAPLCTTGSRAALAAGTGFVCRFGNGQVFSALVRGAATVTVTTSDTPAATAAARVVVAIARQMSELG